MGASENEAGPVADERPARYVEHYEDAVGDTRERVVYRASSLGGCTRAMVASARGYKPAPHPEWFDKVLDEGRRMESVIAAQWAAKKGIGNTPNVDENGRPQQFEVDLSMGEIDGREVIVRCHFDDVSEWYPDDAIGGGGPRLREYKKFRPSTWMNFVAKGVDVQPYYPYQVSAYMHALNLPCEFVGGLYQPADEEKGIEEGIKGVHGTLITEPPVSLVSLKLLVAKVERLINEGYGPDEVECKSLYPCGFWKLHDDKPENKTIELPEDDEELRDAVAEWQQAHSRIAGLKKQVEVMEAAKKEAAEKINTMVENLGHDSTAKGVSFTLGGLRMTRIRSVVAETTVKRKAYTTDYWKMTAKKPSGKGKAAQERDSDQ